MPVPVPVAVSNVVVIRFRVTDPERRGKREWTILRILLEEKAEEPLNTRCAVPCAICISFM